MGILGKKCLKRNNIIIDIKDENMKKSFTPETRKTPKNVVLLVINLNKCAFFTI